MIPPTLARFPVIVGPTAGGKSALAVEVASALRERLGAAGEIVTADSIQIYRGMDIGSAKPTREEMRGVAHHLIDLVEPTDGLTVSDWLARAEAAIAGIRSRGATPIVVGGTHLYVKAFLDGLFDGPPADEALRESLRAIPPQELRRELDRVDPAAAAKIHPSDLRRTIRAIEVYRQTGVPISEHQRQWDREDRTRRDCVLIGLDWPTDQINRRINARVKAMFDRGLVEEARDLWSRSMLGAQAREALGYKQLIDCFEGRCTLDEAYETIKIQTRRFGKNQRTWLNRLRSTPNSVWIDAAATPSERWCSIVIDACGIE